MGEVCSNSAQPTLLNVEGEDTKARTIKPTECVDTQPAFITTRRQGFPNVTAGTKKLAAERYDEVNDRVSTISLQCNSHVQHGAEQHVLLHDVSSEAESCPTQAGMKVAVTVEVSGISQRC